MSEYQSFDLLTLGEIMLRLTPAFNERLNGGEFMLRTAGGAEMNVAAGVAMLGLRTGVISKLPANDLGDFIKKRVRQNGVSDDFLVYDHSKNARLGVYYYEYGAYPRKPRIVYDRMNTSFQTLHIGELDPVIYSSARCFHVSGITLALGEQIRANAIEMIKRFKKEGALISFDVNFRGNLWSGQEARACIEQILPYVDIFFCSDSTARLTFGKKGDVREIMKSFTKDYPIRLVASTERVVLSPKLHNFGSKLYAADTDTFYEEAPYDHIDVVDRIGSGDAYLSGVLYGLLANPGDYQKALEYGNATGSFKNTVPGDLMNTDLTEIQGIIRDHKAAGVVSEMDR